MTKLMLTSNLIQRVLSCTRSRVGRKNASPGHAQGMASTKEATWHLLALRRLRLAIPRRRI